MSISKLFIAGTLLTASMSSVASTINLGNIDDGSSFQSEKVLTGAFSEKYEFDLTGGNYLFGLNVTNTFVKNKIGIQDFKATLDGNDFGTTLYNIDLTASSKSNFLFGEKDVLSSGHHELIIKGIGSKSNFGGSIDVAAVPVPAALWLMGSALVGLVSFGKRKKA